MFSADTLESILSRRMRQYDGEPMPATPTPSGLQMRMEPMGDGGLSDATKGLSDFGSALGKRMRQMTAPDLKPSGINPLGGLPQKGGGHKMFGIPLPHFGGGGVLKKPGDAALVGDDPERGLPPTEMAVKLRGGDTVVAPLGGGALGDRLRGYYEQNGGSFVDPRTYGGAAESGVMYANGAQGQTPAPPASTLAPTLAQRVAEMTARAQGVDQPVDAGAPGPSPAAPTPLPMMPPATRPASEFEPLSVPVTGRPKARNMPAPGEQEANDEGVRSRLSTAGGFTEGGGAHTRQRLHDPATFYRERLNDRIREAEAPPVNKNSGVKSFLKGLGYGALTGIASNPQNPIAGAIGGAVAGGAISAVDKTFDEKVGNNFLAQRLRAQYADMNAREADDLKLQDARAGVRLKNEQADYYGQRPDLERLKLDGQALQRERQNVLAQIRARKGTPFTPDDPLLAQAERLGMHFDADGLNNAASNVISLTLVDPEHPEQTRRAMYNRATGELADVGQSGYVQPVGPDGLTENQRRGDSDRDRGFNALERQRSISNELQRAGLNLSRERFDFSKLERDDRLSENARKEMGAAAKMRREAEQAQMDADSLRGSGMYKDDSGQERQSTRAAMAWKKAQAKAEALRQEYFSTYGYLHEPPEGGEMKMTMDEFRQLFPHAPNPMASAPSYGVVITDSTQPGTPHTNSYVPRRSAPRSPSPRASAGREDPDVRAYADAHFGGDYGAAQRAVEEQRKRKGH